MESLYDNALNFRAGAEFSSGILRFRAGVNMIQDPRVGSDDYDMGVSGGIGVRAGQIACRSCLFKNDGKR